MRSEYSVEARECIQATYMECRAIVTGLSYNDLVGTRWAMRIFTAMDTKTGLVLLIN